MAIQFIPANCPKCNGKLDIDLENMKAVCKYCQTEFIIHDDSVTQVEIVNAEQAGIEFEEGRKIARLGDKQKNDTVVVPDETATDTDTDTIASSGCLLVFFGIIMVWLAFVTFCGFVG